MKRTRTIALGLICSSGLLAGGCEDLPGGRKEQATVGGGVAGAAIGAAVAENRLLGALIGGAIGAGGGYLIGANWDKITGKDRDAAERAHTEAQNNPARPEDVARSSTADLNSDGFVTMDEVIAMERSGLTDEEMIRRLEATNQIFELTPEQEQYLVDQGVSRHVTNSMRTINQEQREQLLRQQEQTRQDVIGSPR